MTTVNYAPPTAFTLKEMVNRILNECGIQSQADLTTSTFLGTTTAINAVNDAINDIKFRNRWEWLKATAVINLQAGIGSYNLPVDFARMCYPFTPYTGSQFSRQIRELTPDEWNQIVPTLVINQPGTPQYYMVDSTVVTVAPAPDTNFVTTYPQLSYTYFKGPWRPLAAVDQNLAIDIPPEFAECVAAFGKWKMKLFLEYPDWQAEQMRYEQSLHVQMNRNNAGRRKPRLRNTYNSNTVW
jgi:hypothetical protein